MEYNICADTNLDMLVISHGGGGFVSVSLRGEVDTWSWRGT